jgi:N6-adenosine-specific RNA methylase IME4
MLYPACGCKAQVNHVTEQLVGGGPFRVVAADPAWKFGDKLPGDGIRGAGKHYDVKTVEDICRLQLPPIHDDAHLFMWRVSAMQQEALDVVRSWGFVVKSELVWLKRTKNGKEHFGMGRHVRLSHEICLIATRGRGAGIKNKSQRSTFTTEHDLDDPAVLSALEGGELGNYAVTDATGGGTFEGVVGRHSRKPDEFFRIIEDLCEGTPRVELFAREARPGWTVIGNQVVGQETTMQVSTT